MDNKITKSRLQDFLSYEWIKMLIFVVVAILAWEMVFAVTGVKITKGQQFMLAYDQGVKMPSKAKIFALATQDHCFSYDVLELGVEKVESSNQIDLFDVKYKTFDIDVIVASNVVSEGETRTRVKYMIDSYEVWAYDDIISDGKEYLKQFAKSDVDVSANPSAVLEYENLDTLKIDSHFIARQAKDNRFRSQAQKEQGKLDEQSRIKDLCVQLKKAEYLLENHSDIFLKYTRYTQLLENNPENEELKDLVNREPQKSYGIDLGKLTGGRYNASEFFPMDGSAKGVVMMCFEFSERQPDLRFESLAFMNYVVSVSSDCLDNFVL